MPQKTRVAATVILLDGPTRVQREQLLRAWQAQLSIAGRRKRFLHPFTPDELASVLDAPGMTPRLLLVAPLRAAAGEPAVASIPTVARPKAQRVAERWNEELARVRADLDERAKAGALADPAELAEGLAATLRAEASLQVAIRSERERVTMSLRGPGQSLEFLFMLATHHASVAGALAKAIELAESGKVVVLREKRQELPRSWETVQARRESFECLPNTRWLWLDEEDCASCVTLARLMSQLRAGRLAHGRERRSPHP